MESLIFFSRNWPSIYAIKATIEANDCFLALSVYQDEMLMLTHALANKDVPIIAELDPSMNILLLLLMKQINPQRKILILCPDRTIGNILIAKEITGRKMESFTSLQKSIKHFLYRRSPNLSGLPKSVETCLGEKDYFVPMLLSKKHVIYRYYQNQINIELKKRGAMQQDLDICELLRKGFSPNQAAKLKQMPLKTLYGACARVGHLVGSRKLSHAISRKIFITGQSDNELFLEMTLSEKCNNRDYYCELCSFHPLCRNHFSC